MEPTLCETCLRGLEFDDEAAGGREDISDNWDAFLAMNTADSSAWSSPCYEGGKRLKVTHHLLRDVFPRLPNLTRSADGSAGCQFCKLLRITLLSDEVKKVPEFQEMISSVKDREVNIGFAGYQWVQSLNLVQEDTAGGKGTIFLRVSVSPTKDSTDGIVLFFRMDPYAKEGEGTGEAGSISRWLRLWYSIPASDCFDSESTAWAKQLIIDAQNGRDCDPLDDLTRSPGFRPKRLVDVRHKPAKLVLGADIPSPSPTYAALSYCWGPPADAQTQLKTTRESISEHLVGIHDDQMTASLRDAVAATRALAIPYLWIDALCILQGEGAQRDWEEQSAIMHEIYQHACVTLVALASSSCREGFLRLRPQPQLNMRWSSKVSPKVAGVVRLSFAVCRAPLGALHDQAALREADLVRCNISSSVWSTRGWTFQEGALSRCFVGFGKSALIFCGRGQVSVMGGATPIENDHGVIFDADRQGTPDGCTWSSIATEYSRRHAGFTRRADFLPGISGLAAWHARGHGLSDQDYVAGLWRHHLPSGLAWRTENPRRTELESLVRSLAHQEPYICPSWSWGMHGDVVTEAEGKAMCEVTAVIRRKGSNPYGELSQGLLKVTGRVAELPLDLCRGDGCWWPMDHPGGDAWNFYLDWDPSGDLVTPGDLRMLLTNFVDGDDLDDEGTLCKTLFGILIHPTGESRPGEYVRVGGFQFDQYNFDDLLGISYFGSGCLQTLEII